MNRRDLIKNLSILSLSAAISPILLKSARQPLYRVKAKAIKSFFYATIKLEYYGKRQCKIGDIITFTEKKPDNIIVIGENPYISTFEIIEHKQIGYYQSKL